MAMSDMLVGVSDSVYNMLDCLCRTDGVCSCIASMRLGTVPWIGSHAEDRVGRTDSVERRAMSESTSRSGELKSPSLRLLGRELSHSNDRELMSKLHSAGASPSLLKYSLKVCCTSLSRGLWNATDKSFTCLFQAVASFIIEHMCSGEKPSIGSIMVHSWPVRLQLAKYIFVLCRMFAAMAGSTTLDLIVRQRLWHVLE